MILSGSSPPVQLLESAEVADILSVEPGTVSRWAEAGRLTAVDGADGHRRFAWDEVMGLAVDVKRTQWGAATRARRSSAAGGPDDPGGEGTAGRERGVMIAEAALDASLVVRDSTSAAALVTGAALTASRARAAVGRAAAAAMARGAAQDVAAARFRADAVAGRVREAATLAAAEELDAAGSDDAGALERAARTAATVEAAAVAVVAETAELARAVARTVAMAAELVATAQVTLERAIEAEVAAAAAGVQLRAMAAAHMTSQDVAFRMERAPSE